MSHPIIGLVGTDQPKSYDATWYVSRLADENLWRQIAKSGLPDVFSVFGLAVADSGRLASYSNRAEVNTDDHARVTFTAPSFIYGTQADVHTLLFELLDMSEP